MGALMMHLEARLKDTRSIARSSCCGESRSTCCPPPKIDLDDETPPPKVVNPTADQYKYSGDALMAATFPLGALGGGCIAVAGDGGLRQWQVCNVVNHDGHVPDSFFAVRVGSGTSSSAAVLMSPALYNKTGFKPAAYVTDHVIPQASKDLLAALPGIETVEITAKFPIVEIDYTSPSIPVQIHAEAFSPCIPLDSKNSALPVIIFNYTVTNPTTSTVEVSLLGSLQNIAGWNGHTVIANEVEDAAYGGNTNATLTKTTGYTALDMMNPTLPATSSQNGHISLAVLNSTGDAVSVTPQYDAVKDLWASFAKTGKLPAGSTGPSPTGKTWNGAISLTKAVGPKQAQAFTFLLAWHFPHRYVNWSQERFGIKDEETQFYIGNQYATFWPTIQNVLDYTVTNVAALTDKTRAFQDAMFNSTLPWQLIDSAAGRVSVLNSPTCMWHGDGNFYAFEGCRTTAGCCPLNCTHVWNYEFTLSRLWPDLERTMRAVDLQAQLSPNAILPSRTTVPLELRRQWSFWPDYTQVNPASTSICVDGEIGTVNKTYREVLQGAPKNWFDNQLHQVKKVMQRWMTELDDGTGVIRGPQPNTYDCAIYGVNTFIGTQYLCALRAAEEMAKLQGDAASATAYHERFAMGSETLEKLCFTNGKNYTQAVDPAHAVEVMGDGTHADALMGWWWARALNLGDILPIDHVKSSLQATFTQNHVTAFDPKMQSPRPFFDQRDAGIYIERWPDGKVPSKAIRYSSEGAWTGLEYPFAAQCLYAGLEDVFLQVLTEARAKYDGTRRSPWNEIECGDHYSRPMSALQLFEVASGITWSFVSVPKVKTVCVNLSFAPRLSFTNYRGFFILATCFGQYVQIGNENLAAGTAQVSIAEGELVLNQLQIKSTASAATATISHKPVEAKVSQNEGVLTLAFTTTVTLHASEAIAINIG
ncbi:non-lysosomal glucosylceramidase-like isoform X2 [Oscarella lobularis]|uniref:non-lysosomal glucosylceramidase-like isoform X2 n=1 Tax=Oscarella lobularis TaxID=121494 RepID=UPI0033139DA0